jgi:hypothetical protein
MPVGGLRWTGSHGAGGVGIGTWLDRAGRRLKSERRPRLDRRGWRIGMGHGGVRGGRDRLLMCGIPERYMSRMAWHVARLGVGWVAYRLAGARNQGEEPGAGPARPFRREPLFQPPGGE